MADTLTAGEYLRQENLDALRPDVVRIAAGLAANPGWLSEARLSRGANTKTVAEILAGDALAVVRAIDAECNGEADNDG